MPPSSTTTTLSQQPPPSLSIPLLDVIQNNNNTLKPQQNMMMNLNYNEMKPTHNDFWFNEQNLPKQQQQQQPTIASPTRLVKSLFSPSPEHMQQDDKAKYMMMTSNVKRESVEIPKEEKKTPIKREKMSSGSSSKIPQISPVDKKFIKNEASTVDLSSLSALSQDTSLVNKKRPYSSVKDSLETTPSGSARGEKIRKTESNKTESMPRMMQQHFETPIGLKQPIETNPDSVKSLLKECFSSSNKFDPFDNDSPLDVIHSEPPEQLLAIPSLQSSSIAAASSLANSILLNGEPYIFFSIETI